MNIDKLADMADKMPTMAGAIRKINAAFRDEDDSHLWPICGRFNATERAIRRVRKYVREYGVTSSLEYCYMLENEISNIVNEEI